MLLFLRRYRRTRREISWDVCETCCSLGLLQNIVRNKLKQIRSTGTWGLKIVPFRRTLTGGFHVRDSPLSYYQPLSLQAKKLVLLENYGTTHMWTIHLHSMEVSKESIYQYAAWYRCILFSFRTLIVITDGSSRVFPCVAISATTAGRPMARFSSFAGPTTTPVDAVEVVTNNVFYKDTIFISAKVS